jgi:uncharacterized membrane protein YhaH (DUF805 family)
MDLVLCNAFVFVLIFVVTRGLTGATTVIATLALLTVFTAWLSFRVRRLRPLLETNGKISFATR